MANKLTSAWIDVFMTSGTPDGALNDIRKLVRFVNTFSSLGILAIVGFGFVNTMIGNQSTGYIEILLGILAALNLVYLHTSKQPTIAASILLAIFFFALNMLIITGGVERTGIYWFSVFPILAFFLKGKRIGVLWILVLIASVLLLLIAAQSNVLIISYTAIEIRQLVATLFIVSMFIYLFLQHIREQDQVILAAREQKLHEENSALRIQIETQKEAQVRQHTLIGTIDKTITEIQQKNRDLEDTKRATMNILEDLGAEKRLTEESRRKDEALLESIGEGMIATDADGIIIVANRQAKELLGYTEEQMIGKSYHQIIQPVGVDAKPIAIKDSPMTLAMNSGKPTATSSYQYVRKDSTTFPAAMTASPIEIGGKRIGGIVVFRDITKEKQIDKAKTEFVSLASHQLRTPLSAISWYVEMLLSGDAGKLATAQIEYMKEIQRGSKRLVDMVNSLLNVSRIELGTFMVEPTPTKPVEIAEAVLGEVKALIEKKQLVLEREFAKDIPILKLDQHLLQIILQNLISNSIKYTPEKGKIVVSLGMKDDMLGIKVRDSGIGIPKDQQVHIFEKLFRADNVRSTDTDGTGLGLYMVKQIVTEIGGTISFTSAAHKGTTMLVLLPATGMKRKEGTRRLS